MPAFFEHSNVNLPQYTNNITRSASGTFGIQSNAIFAELDELFPPIRLDL